MNGRNLTRLGAIATVALAVAGCGQSNTSCPTETPRVDQVQSCTVAPGATVGVRLNICPTCNQTAASCTADLSQLGSSNTIALDPITDSCEPANSCPSPSCAVNGVTCTFNAPTTPGDYTMIVFDPASNGTRSATLTVASGPTSCAFTTAGL
ncbi:hypothetical protein [Anaeromyxobacter oryzae]|uniref:Lipoprotein n=1 Tax=Anaeromyxobacter oryzae TaxID=2918170 RepID=A0ABM7X1Y7_9BACT|nr:hypothetical protein [Anaeromyxobacter oryzae]BDG05789.1 hypothetical protein AMOR_47850 [Anaeromyxobacter oryzae]